MATVLLLAGGVSAERAVSLRSGAAVTTALQTAGHDVTVIDPAEPISDEALRQHDVIFPVLHGLGGEDGVIQSRLEALGCNNFVGSGAAASKLCFDKWQYKAALAAAGLPTPAGVLVTSNPVTDQPLTKQPFVLKPNDGGSSIDTFIIREPTTADFTALDEAVERHGQMLLETLVSGVEITVGVLGDVALPVIEIIPPASGEFDYENKYNGATQELCPPQHVSAALQIQAQQLALQAHQLMGCRDFSRTDIMITPTGGLYILETNTIPGMTDQSLLPKAAATAGISMVDLCNRLVEFALARKPTT